jgi:hypothetical protein
MPVQVAMNGLNLKFYRFIVFKIDNGVEITDDLDYAIKMSEKHTVYDNITNCYYDPAGIHAPEGP